MNTSRLSLAEQIAQLEETAPVDHDPEDFEVWDTGKDEMGSAHYVDVGHSTLRNALPSVADPKYEGVRMSRRNLHEESEEESGTEDEDEPLSEDEAAGLSHYQKMDESYSPNQRSDMEESNTPPPEHTHISPKRKLPVEEDSFEDTNLSLNMKKAREDDVKKGEAVKHQLSLWDTLLDTRIRMQKCVTSANLLPPPSKAQQFLQAPGCQDSILKFLSTAIALSEELTALQEELIVTNKVVEHRRKRQKVDDFTSLDDYTEAFSEAAADAVALEQSLHPFVLQTLSKWSSKIQAVAPSALVPSNRGAFLKGNQQPKSAVQLIDEALIDTSKMLERTRTPRLKQRRIGVEPNDAEVEEADTETFDDTEFYQKMLKDIIGSRRDGNKNDDWMVLQKQNKAKKKVDTKASKGRKLRYEVHEKIQNFMVPVPVPGAWHDEQIDELFSSLLGKGFENISLGAEQPIAQENVELTGFRVFG